MPVNEFGFDDEFFEQIGPKILDPLYKGYWRVEPIGIDNVPTEGGALLVANHSGMVPFDAMMIKAAVWTEVHRNVRILVERFVYDLPFINVLFSRTGQVLANPLNTIHLLDAGELVAVFPEGVRGISQPYSNRYRLQRFGRGGYIRMAIKTQVPIVPVAVVGAEEIFHVLFNFKPLAKLLGFPYIPVTTTFPLLGAAGALPKPTKWYIAFGKPLALDEYPPEAAEDDALVQVLSERVKSIIQNMLFTTLRKRQSVMLGS